MLDDLQHLNKPVQIVLTKIDKLKDQTDIIRVVADTTSKLQKYNKFVYPMVHITSAEHLFGISELRAKIGIGFDETLRI